MSLPPSEPHSEPLQLNRSGVSDAPLVFDPEAVLLSAIADGDRSAVATLYDRFAGPLHAVAHRILNDPVEAEDIVHDVFVSVLHKAGEFQSARGTAFTWLVALVRNRAIDRLRRRRRRRELIEASVPGEIGPASAGEEIDSAARIGLQENALQVRSAVATLAPDQRSAVELAFFGGLTQLEIADRLQAPLGTIKARIRRGLLKLRDTLASR